MKPKKQPNGAKKLPKPAVHYSTRFRRGMSNATHSYRNFFSEEPKEEVFPVLVLPLPTKRAALAKKKWEGLSYEEKVEAGARAIGRLAYKEACAEVIGTGTMIARKPDAKDLKFYAKYVRAILALTGEPSP